MAQIYKLQIVEFTKLFQSFILIKHTWENVLNCFSIVQFFLLNIHTVYILYMYNMCVYNLMLFFILFTRFYFELAQTKRIESNLTNKINE